MAEYIEREAAYSLAKKVCEAVDSNPRVLLPQIILALIDDVPAADVQPVRHGRWRLYSPLTDTFECDKCGYQVIDESFRTNYCPNCGADMREADK